MELVAVVATDAGMHALWDVERFATIDGYEAWSHELEEDADIVRHIEAGHFVPINIRSDGAFCISVRADRDAMPVLSTDEEPRVVVRSDAYRLTTSGRIAVSGIEHVGPVNESVAEGRLEPGDYDAVVHLMDYDDVPGPGNEQPDFLITIGPPLAPTVRTAVATFAAP